MNFHSANSPLRPPCTDEAIYCFSPDVKKAIKSGLFISLAGFLT
jgi:hypothetical protein